MKDKTKKLIQDHVHSHEYDIDPSDIWSGIEAKQKKKKRKGFFWITGLGLLLISSVILTTLYFTIDSNNTSEHTNQVSNDSSNKTSIPSNEVQTNSNQNTNSNTSITNIENQEQKPQTTLNSKSNNQIKSSQSLNNKSVQKLNTGNSTFKTAQKRNSKTAELPIDKIAKDVAVNTVDELTKTTSNSIANNILTTKILDIQPDLSDLKKSVTKVRQSMTAFATIKQSLNLFEIDKKQPSISNDKIDSNFKRSTWVDLEEEKIRYPLLSLSALQSVALFQKQVTANQGVNQDYTNARNATEKPLERFGSTLLVNADLTKWLTLSTGVEYQKINEQFNWKGSYLIDENDNIIGPVPAVETIAEEDMVRIVDRDMEIFNNYQLINIPIQVSLHHNFKSINYGVYGGASINVWNKTEGTSLDQSLFPTELVSLKAQFKTQWTAGFFTEIPVHKAWKIRAAFGLNQANIQETLTSNKYNFKEFTLGLKYQF